MRIKDWPEDDRPREKLLAQGPLGLTDSELLAILLRSGTNSGNVSAMDLARMMIEKAGGLAGLSESSAAELCEFPGCGPAKAATVMAAAEIARRVSANRKQQGQIFSGGEAVFQHYSWRLSDAKQEHFIAAYLDVKNKLLADLDIALGGISGVFIEPREAFAPALRHNAARVIFVHNHPSGDPSPSAEDKALTRRLCESGELLAVEVLDHVIIGKSAYFSFAESGLL